MEGVLKIVYTHLILTTSRCSSTHEILFSGKTFDVRDDGHFIYSLMKS